MKIPLFQVWSIGAGIYTGYTHEKTGVLSYTETLTPILLASAFHANTFRMIKNVPNRLRRNLRLIQSLEHVSVDTKPGEPKKQLTPEGKKDLEKKIADMIPKAEETARGISYWNVAKCAGGLSCYAGAGYIAGRLLAKYI